jgi:hypothetical protein
MPNQPYYPPREGDQITFFTNIQTKIPGYYTALDISPTRQAKLTLVLGWLIWTWQTYLPARRADGPAATTWRNNLANGNADAATSATPPVPATLTPPAGTPFYGMLTWLFEEIGRWKTAEGYTDTIGKDLGIIGAVQGKPDFVTLKPVITAMISGATVQVGWDWGGYSTFLDQCEIQVDRGDAKGFIPLAIDTTPGYTDTAPFPATPTKWTYRAIYRVDDVQAGLWSGAVSVTVGG